MTAPRFGTLPPIRLERPVLTAPGRHVGIDRQHAAQCGLRRRRRTALDDRRKCHGARHRAGRSGTIPARATWSRQRTNREPCRNRPSCSCPNVTSATRSIRSGTQLRSLPASQRLPAPGMRTARFLPAFVDHSAQSGSLMILERVVGQRFQLSKQLGASFDGERRHNTDVMQIAAVVVQAEQQRPDSVAVLVDSIAGDATPAVRWCLDLDRACACRACRDR